MNYTLENGLPEGFFYPKEFVRIIEQELTNLTPWMILNNDLLTVRLKGLKTRYPERNLLPFAQRIDNDDIACFDIDKVNSVVVIHDFASNGWEKRKVFVSFWDWFKQAIDDLIEYDY